MHPNWSRTPFAVNSNGPFPNRERNLSRQLAKELPIGTPTD